jgi:hypothetical protein
MLHGKSNSRGAFHRQTKNFRTGLGQYTYKKEAALAGGFLKTMFA